MACCEEEGKGPLAGLYVDFGDVREDDFRAWWGGSLQRGALLFGEQPIPLRLIKLESKDEWDDAWSDQDVLVIAVNRHFKKQRLETYFSKLLAKEEIGAQGRLALAKANSTSRYPLYRNFSQYSLKVMLETYDAWIANQSLPKAEQLTLWQIGEALKLVPSAITLSKDTKYELTNKRNVMSVAVSRYIKSAKAIIANTARGQFPNSKLPAST